MESKPMEIVPTCDRGHLLLLLETILQQQQEATADYLNSTPIVQIPEQRKGKDQCEMSWSVPISVKELCLIGAIAQSPVALRGDTDKGKTALAAQTLNGLFGLHEKHWWRVEVSTGMTQDDFLDVDVGKLKDSKLSEAMSAAPWVSFPGMLLDEINRAPAKLNNTLLHLIDGTGFHLRGLTVPVGLPYQVNGTLKRYSFCICTANNKKGNEYDGIFAEDAALVRRIVLSENLDDIPVTTRDVANLLNAEEKRTRMAQTEFPSMVKDVVSVYESLPKCIPFSALAHLLLHYYWGLGTCVRTRSGRLRTELTPAICQKCHLAKSHRFCGRVGGLSEGLLICCKEISRAIAALRAVKVLRQVRTDCSLSRHRKIREFLGSSASGDRLYEEFCKAYTSDLRVEGEDVVAAYTLIAPGHVWIRKDFLSSQENYEKSERYAFADVATSSWECMKRILVNRQGLFSNLAENREITPHQQGEVESLVTTEDSAMLAVISAFRDESLPLKFREIFTISRAA